MPQRYIFPSQCSDEKLNKQIFLHKKYPNQYFCSALNNILDLLCVTMCSVCVMLLSSRFNVWILNKSEQKRGTIKSIVCTNFYADIGAWMCFNFGCTLLNLWKWVSSQRAKDSSFIIHYDTFEWNSLNMIQNFKDMAKRDIYEPLWKNKTNLLKGCQLK